MKKELDKQLCDKYPEIFADRYKDMLTTAMCWGIETGDGWFNIIDALCGNIQSYIDNNPHLNTSQVVATQVKEKYGTLSFYYYGGNEFIDGMVEFAETISGITCEVCGMPGTLEGPNWFSTRCQEHKS